jgi:hypothetical protein
VFNNDNRETSPPRSRGYSCRFHHFPATLEVRPSLGSLHVADAGFDAAQWLKSVSRNVIERYDDVKSIIRTVTALLYEASFM